MNTNVTATLEWWGLDQLFKLRQHRPDLVLLLTWVDIHNTLNRLRGVLRVKSGQDQVAR